MTSSTQRSVCGARLRLSWRGFRPRDRCLWPADSHLGGQRSYAWGGSVHISPRDDVGRVDPLRTYCTLTWRRSETLLSTRQQTAFASPANLSPKYTETSPLVASDRFLQRDAACTWRRLYSAQSVHNLRGPEDGASIHEASQRYCRYRVGDDRPRDPGCGSQWLVTDHVGGSGVEHCSKCTQPAGYSGARASRRGARAGSYGVRQRQCLGGRKTTRCCRVVELQPHAQLTAILAAETDKYRNGRRPEGALQL